jgi:glutamine synthetase
MAGYTREEALEYVRENDIKFIRLAFCDIYGTHKNVSIMPEELEKAFDVGVGFDSFKIDGFDDPLYRSLLLVPDPSTLNTLPWRPQQGGVIRFYCDVVTNDGKPFPYDARKFLRDTLKECKENGFSVRLAIRSEFYLFKTDDSGNPTDITWDNGGYYDIAPDDRGENIRREICLCLEEMGLHPVISYHESGPGQNEIDFKGDDALRSAEHFFTYKNVVTSVSARNGIYASFSPKPIKGKSGNGLHLQIRLHQAGVDMDDIDPEITRHFMAGILNRMRDITVFLNTTSESYLRFGENEAPRFISWTESNLSSLIRVSIVGGKKEGFVLRSPDSEINPYLAYSMIIQAGIEGIKNGEELTAPEESGKAGKTAPEESGKAGKSGLHKAEDQELTQLPMTIEEAVQCAKNSEFLKNEKRALITERFIEKIEQREKF